MTVTLAANCPAARLGMRSSADETGFEGERTISAPSATREAGLPFLEERGHAFALILAGECITEGGEFLGQGLPVTAFHRLVDQALGDRHGER